MLLVEGDDDRAIVEEVFLARRRVWERSVRVIAAGGREAVIRARARFSDRDPRMLHMFVDRDTWTEHEIQNLSRELGASTLHVTAGWCLENIFFAPDFLRMLHSEIAQNVAAAREVWVRAGARWWTLQRWREASQQVWNAAFGDGAYGGLHPGVDPKSGGEFADILSHRISPDTLARFAFDIDALAAEFDARLRTVESWSEHDQWQIGVHGKRAFVELLCPLLEKYYGRRIDWRLELVGRLPRPFPVPLDGLVAMFLP